MANDESLLSTEDLAGLTNVPLGTVYAWNYKGTGPRRLRIGRHVRYRRTDVEAWLADHAEPRPDDAA